MSSLDTRHPSEEQLLRYADGELASRDASAVRSHLAACWQCRTEFEEIQQTIGECVRYRKAVYEDGVPPPPAPWFDIYDRMSGVDARLGSRSVFGRLADALSSGLATPRRWVPAAAAVGLIFLVVHQLSNTPSVRAAALLRKAVSAAESRPAQPRRVQIRTRTQRLTHVVGARPQAALDTKDAVALQAQFRAAHYSWDDPLSARSYAEWRSRLSDKQDEITEVVDSRLPARNCYRIRTTTQSGPLVAASLTLRALDFRAVEGTLLFRDREWVEITELPAETPLESASAATPEPALSRSVPAALEPLPESVPAQATPGDELQVFAALRRAEADLDEPIEVTRTEHQILVAGVGVAPERQREIRNALEPVPRVVLRFSEPDAAAFQPPVKPSPATPARPDVLRLQATLENSLGGRAAFEQLADPVLASSDVIMSRAHALRRLAQRFPPDLEAQLSVEERQLLQKLRREHSAALVEQAAGIQRRVKPALVAWGVPAEETQRTELPAGPWQAATEELFRTARQAEIMLAVLLGGAPNEEPAGALPSRVLSSLAHLVATAEAYDSLTRDAR